jgi:ABC-2 type transport system permease protein
MKRLLAFIKKEFFHIFRDRRTLLILFGIPIVQIILFGFAITNEINNANISIVDHSRDQWSKRITNKLTSSGYFTLESYTNNIEEVHKLFKAGRIKMAIIIPKDLKHNIQNNKSVNIQLLADATEPNTAAILVNYASAIITSFNQEVFKIDKIQLPVESELRMLYNPKLESVHMFVPGVVTVILMLISAMMTSITITREKELGTMEVLLISPLRPTMIIAGKVIPYILLAFVNAVVILLLSYFVFHVPLRGNLILLALECILFVITALALGILISTKAQSQQVAMMISLMALMLPTIMLSGFIFPVESMPVILQWISNIIPAKWFLIIIKNIMLKGSGIFFIWKETLILLVMTFIFIVISIRNFKIRLE